MQKAMQSCVAATPDPAAAARRAGGTIAVQDTIELDRDDTHRDDAHRDDELDHELAGRFRDGDDAALRQMYDRYRMAVFRQVVRSLPTTADAEDVTQATFVAAWLGRRTFDPQRGELLGWLLGIARHRATDQLRARAREQRIAESVRALPDRPAATSDPERMVDRMMVTDALEDLPAEQRRLLHLAFYDGLSHQQIATRSDLPLGTVKSQIRRGLAGLKRRWEREGTAPGTTA